MRKKIHIRHLLPRKRVSTVDLHCEDGTQVDSSFFVDGSSTYLGGSGRRSEQLEKRLPGIEFSQGRQVEKRGEKKLSLLLRCPPTRAEEEGS